MFLFGKFAVALFIVVVVQVHSTTSDFHDGSYKYRDAIRPVQEATDSPVSEEDLKLFMIHGQIYCNEETIDGVRPFFQNPNVPDGIAVMDTTHDGGNYRLLVNHELDGEEEAWLTIRHQCPVRGLTPRKECAVPYFWTEISIPLRNGTFGRTYNFDLAKMETYTRPTCLY